MKCSSLTRALLAFAFVSFPALADVRPQDEESAEASDESADGLAESVEKIIDDFQLELSEFFRERRQLAQEEKDYSHLVEPDGAEPRRAMWELIQDHLASDPGREGLIWLVSRGGAKAKEREDFLATLVAYHATSDDMLKVCRLVASNCSPATFLALNTIEAQNKDPEVRGTASMTRARLQLRRASLVERLNDENTDADRMEYYRELYGDAILAVLAKLDVDELRKNAEAELERTGREYKDVEYRDGTMGEYVGYALFELRNLQIGMKAPDIAGEDLAGIPFKLSDYRGKVVVLDFWGDW